MTRELFWLAMTAGLTGLLWLPYMLDRLAVRGFWGTMANPSRDDTPQSPWAQRLYFAHTNAVDNIAVFAPLVLILNSIDYSSRWTVLACAVYFWSRLAHAIFYAFGIVVARTLAFGVSFVAQVVLFMAIFGWA